MILSTQPCNSQSATPVTHIEGVNTDNMLLKNSKATISTLKAVWSLWNHSHCKYEDSECRVLNGRAQYAQGDASALKVVLKNSEIQKVKYTGFRAFNSQYPCHGQGDLLVNVPGLGTELQRHVLDEFLGHSNHTSGTFDESHSLLSSETCPRPKDNKCTSRVECDKEYHALNKHGQCRKKTEITKLRGG